MAEFRGHPHELPGRFDPLVDADAGRHGIGKDTVARIWRDHGLKPWKVETFKISNDPRFEEKLVDVVGLYLDPPTGGGVQLRREDPGPGAGPHPAVAADDARAGPGTMTHDYKRNGTIDLFAAMNIGTGEVLTDCRNAIPPRRARLLQADRRHVPRGLSVHVVLDNLSAHMPRR